MVFDDLRRIVHFSATALFAWTFLTTEALAAEGQADPIVAMLQSYSSHSTNYASHPNNTASAWKFAKACFELADITTNTTLRGKVAKEGIAAAETAIQASPQSAAAHLYLGLNRGQLARTKLLGAIGLVKEMEQAFLASIQADESFDHAAAHRSLGMLYLEAPSWPVSIGNRVKARNHLEKSIELSPNHPDNHLSAIEAYLSWKDSEKLTTSMERYRRLLLTTKIEYTGLEWDQARRDWEARWRTIQANSEKHFPATH